MSALKVCPQCGSEYPHGMRFCQTDGSPLHDEAGNGELAGSIVAGRYHVMKKIGEGGMGEVYLAEHVKMGRRSALKIMRPRGTGRKDVEAISRFNREAANASRISHSNVAAVYDFGETAEGILYLAMEYVDGVQLTAIMAREGALAPRRVASIVRQIGNALAAAHDLGIVHRDLKPDNVMITRDRDGNDLVKVVDFGIAKAAEGSTQKVTQTGLIVGTPDYMSPEQVAGDPVDARSDVYAMGLVAFHMLSGRLPFSSDSRQESIVMRLTDRPARLADVRPGMSWPDAVQQMLDRALERDATLRHRTAIDFASALGAALDDMTDGSAPRWGDQSGAPIPATRVAAGPFREASRRRWYALIATGGVLALFVGVVVVWPGRTGIGTGSAIDAPVAQYAVLADSVDVAALLVRLEGAADDSVGALRTLGDLNQLEAAGRLRNADDAGHAAFIRFKAKLGIGDREGACISLRYAIERTADAREQTRYARRLPACP
jgi:Protein kinase domain